MFTRCPDCATRFRVRPEQLRIAGGKVRCGQCGCVFDAQPPPDIEVADVAVEVAGLVTEDARESDAAGYIGGRSKVAERDRRRGARRRRAGGATAGWSIGSLLMIVALGAQWIWWDRHALAAHPEGFRLVQWLCRYAPCHALPPKVPENIEVLGRSLAPHPTSPNALRFALRIVNRGAQVQPFPIIELSLSDRKERLAGVRRFTPETYLDQDTLGSGLMQPAVPIEIKLDLVDPGSHVTDFRIDFL
jgi:predicted Zn finger-like uncharacterized protein